MIEDEALEKMSKRDLIAIIKSSNEKLEKYEHQDLRDKLLNDMESVKGAVSHTGVYLARNEWVSLRELANTLKEYAEDIEEFLRQEFGRGSEED